jgi:hypothetical protein
MSGDVQSVISRLQSELDPDKAAAVDRTYELRFVGDERRFTLALDEGGVQVKDGPAPAGACGLGFHPEDIDSLLDGTTTLSALFSARRMRVFGNVGDAMRLEQVLSPKA